METDLELRASPSLAQAPLVRALCDPACYPHPAGRVEVIETHISWVFLAGEYAYKVKKPVRLPFLDFSTLAARRRYCEEELRLNRRFAPALYLDVVGIGGDRARPRIGGEDPFEYAVRMRRFPGGALFTDMACGGVLEATHVEALAGALARTHAGAERVSPRVPPDPARAALANFDQMAPLALGKAIDKRLAALRRWTLLAAGALAVRFAGRAAAGFVRECHGDLHLGNVAWIDGAPVPFDGIEFSEALRFTDVASDAAFVSMDLVRHGLEPLAARFLDRYLAETGDYEALHVLRFYQVYRAMVRAKVAAIGLGQAPPGSPRARSQRAELLDFLGVAERLARRGPALLVLMHGLSGSGKTQASGRLLERLGAVRVRSDVERKRLAGLSPEARAGAAPGAGLYDRARSRETYARLEQVAHAALLAGFAVIVDAASLRHAQRARFAALAHAHGAQFLLVACVAPREVLRERIEARARQERDASDADLAVIEWQARACEPPSTGEPALVLDTAQPDCGARLDALAARLREAAS